MYSKEKYVAAQHIHLAGCQCEDEGRDLNATTWYMRPKRTVTYVWFDFGSEMFLALIALLMYIMCQLSINNPIEAIILLENVELDCPAKLYRGE